jgi:hypothetical protein
MSATQLMNMAAAMPIKRKQSSEKVILFPRVNNFTANKQAEDKENYGHDGCNCRQNQHYYPFM